MTETIYYLKIKSDNYSYFTPPKNNKGYSDYSHFVTIIFQPEFRDNFKKGLTKIEQLLLKKLFQIWRRTDRCLDGNCHTKTKIPFTQFNQFFPVKKREDLEYFVNVLNSVYHSDNYLTIETKEKETIEPIKTKEHWSDTMGRGQSDGLG